MATLELVLNPYLRKISVAAGVPEISAHGLRRTFDKLLRKAEVEGFVRRSMAGWRPEGRAGDLH